MLTKYPDVNNALDKHQVSKYNGPMKASDFDKGKIDWFKANVEITGMISRLCELRKIGGRSEGYMSLQRSKAAGPATLHGLRSWRRRRRRLRRLLRKNMIHIIFCIYWIYVIFCIY